MPDTCMVVSEADEYQAHQDLDDEGLKHLSDVLHFSTIPLQRIIVLPLEL
jgi:hypothetical protein